RCVRVLEGADKTPENIAETLVRGLGVTPAGESALARDGVASGDSTLELRGVTDHKRLFRGLDFAVAKGLVTALIGVEGSGGGAVVQGGGGLRRAQGEIRVNGQPQRPGQLHPAVAFVAADRAESLF